MCLLVSMFPWFLHLASRPKRRKREAGGHLADGTDAAGALDGVCFVEKLGAGIESVVIPAADGGVVRRQAQIMLQTQKKS